MPRKVVESQGHTTTYPDIKPTRSADPAISGFYGLHDTNEKEEGTEVPKSTLRDCLLAHKPSQDEGSDADDNKLNYQCVVSCAHGKTERDITGETVVNEWGDCG